MPQRISPILPQTIGSISGVLLFSSLVLSLWGRSGGPAWAQWLGGAFLGCVLIIPVILYMFDPQHLISWFWAMKPRRRGGDTSKPLLWSHLKNRERILILIGIIVISVIGGLILLNTVPHLLRIWRGFLRLPG